VAGIAAPFVIHMLIEATHPVLPRDLFRDAT